MTSNKMPRLNIKVKAMKTLYNKLSALGRARSRLLKLGKDVSDIEDYMQSIRKEIVCRRQAKIKKRPRYDKQQLYPPTHYTHNNIARPFRG